MRARPSSASTSAGATAAARRTEPDAVALEPIGDHRIIIHLSRATRSFCLETGEQFLRQAGDIDVVPSGATFGRFVRINVLASPPDQPAALSEVEMLGAQTTQ